MNNPEHLLPCVRSDQTVVMVADDEPMIRNIARIWLEAEGYFILTAADGQEALLLSRAYPRTIHLVVSDVEMPNMDGLQLREKLLEERPGTKMLLMSGQAAVPVELRKPFLAGTLIELVREMLPSRIG